MRYFLPWAAAAAAVVLLALEHVATASPTDGVTQEITRRLIVPRGGSPVLHEDSEIKIHNTGSTPLTKYILTMPTSRAQQVLYLQAHVGASNEHAPRDSLEVIWPSMSPTKKIQKLTITLEPAVLAGEKVNLHISAAYRDSMYPSPAWIPQSGRQFYRLEEFVGLGTGYTTTAFSLELELPSESTETLEYDKGEAQRVGKKLVYGPYTNDPVKKRLSVRFFGPSIGLVATSVHREIWVRGVGESIEIDEWIDVEHRGAKLQGFFNRFELMTARDEGSLNVIRGQKIVVPEAAYDIFYRDEIGNVSTSAVSRVMQGSKAVDFAFRYPLYGGWKYNWNYGFAVPAAGYIDRASTSGGNGRRHTLRFPLESLMINLLVEAMDLRVVLPEGARDVAVSLEIDGLSTELDQVPPGSQVRADAAEYALDHTYYYLDTIGRPVVVLRRTNVIGRDPRAYIKVSYRPTILSYVLKPAVVATAVGVIVVALLTWTIGFKSFKCCKSQLAPSSSKKRD